MSARSFVVPGEPVALGRARVSVVAGHARMYTPAASVAHKEAWAWAAKAAGVSMIGPNEVIGVDVVASWLYPRGMSEKKIREELARLAASPAYLGLPKVTKPDVDNIAKLGLDGLNGIAWKDDGQVAVMRAAKVWGPRAETHVRIWTGDAPAFPERWWR